MILLFLTPPPFPFHLQFDKKSSLKFIPTDQIGERISSKHISVV